MIKNYKAIRIILVDDDSVNIQLCQMVFAKMMSNIEFIIFQEGISAFNWISDNQDEIKNGSDFILLLDLNMPLLDGWGFLDYYEKLDEATQLKFNIYILTSSIDEDDINRSKQYPSVRSFFSKPLTSKIIRKILAETGYSIAS